MADESHRRYGWRSDGRQHRLDLVSVENVSWRDITAPVDGAPWRGPGVERRLRGGCHHNWDLHCRVFWRYGIAADAHDGCIGFRLVLGNRRAG